MRKKYARLNAELEKEICSQIILLASRSKSGKVTWAQLVEMTGFTRQALSANKVISDAYHEVNGTQTAVVTAEKRIEELETKLARSESECERLNAMLKEYDKKYARWIYNATNANLSVEQLNKPIPESLKNRKSQEGEIMSHFDVEVELAEFDLNRMHPSGKANLIKVAELFGPLDSSGWLDYIEYGSIDLNAMAKELEIARSSFYQNKHIKRYVLELAEKLRAQGLISELPYQPRDHKGSGTGTGHYTTTDKELQEKNMEIKRLQLQVAELTAKVDGLKSELRASKQKLEQSDLRAHHLSQFGRYPR